MLARVLAAALVVVRAGGEPNLRAALDCVRLDRARLLRDAFFGRVEVAGGLWFEEGGREVLSGKMTTALREGRPFVVAFGGTSITAGHDNYLNQTYPAVFEREAAGAFALAGAPLVARNVAHGANPHVPYAACAREFYGVDVDVVSIEMKVMSKAKATGRSRKDGQEKRSALGGGRLAAPAPAAAMTELLVRNALALPNRPAVLLADGVFSGPRQKRLAPRREPPPDDWAALDGVVAASAAATSAASRGGRSGTTNSTRSSNLLSHYGGLGLGLHRLDLGVATWFVDHFPDLPSLLADGGATSGTFSSSAAPSVAAASAAGQPAEAAGAAGASAAPPNPFSWAALNGGKAFEHIGWHPGPGHHALRGRILAFAYLGALEAALEALLLAERPLLASPGRGQRSGAAAKTAGAGRASLLPPLPPPPSSPPPPPPLLCAPWLCGAEVACATTYEPRSGSGLGALAAAAHVSARSGTQSHLASPEPMDLGRRSAVDTPLPLPSSLSSFSSSSSSSSTSTLVGSGWRHVLFSKTRQAVRQAVDQRRGYLDRKFVLQSPVAAATLSPAHDPAHAPAHGDGDEPPGGGADASTGLTSGRRLRLELPRAQVGSAAAGSAARRFVCLCEPWTGSGPEGWAALSPSTAAVWLDGERIDLAVPGLAAAAAPLGEGPCLPVFVEPPPGAAVGAKAGGGAGGGDGSGSGSDGSSSYVVEVEAAKEGTFITISHALWR